MILFYVNRLIKKKLTQEKQKNLPQERIELHVELKLENLVVLTHSFAHKNEF